MNIEDNLGLVRRLAAKHQPRCLDYDDAVQEASIAFLEAVEKYDGRNGTTFRGYLDRVVKWHMMGVAKKQEGDLKRPQTDKPVYANVKLDSLVFQEDAKLPYHEVIEDEDAESPEDAVYKKELQTLLLSFCNQLNYRDQVIFQRRLLHPEPQPDVGRDLGLSRQSLGVHEARLKTRLKGYLLSRM